MYLAACNLRITSLFVRYPRLSNCAVTAISSGCIVVEDIQRKLTSVKSVVAALYIAILLIILAYLIGEAMTLQIFVEPLVGVNYVFVVHIVLH